jgi:hypothetical protein
LREGGKYRPLPATWLRQHRWHDEPILPRPGDDLTIKRTAAGELWVAEQQSKT